MSESKGSHGASGTLAPAADFFKLGSELLSEVQKSIGEARVKALRVSLGNRTLREFPVRSATVVVTILVVISAILITNLKIEIVKEPNRTLPDDSSNTGEPS
jgi:hypothetical protein